MKNKMKTLFVTQKGADMKSNGWVLGQKISCGISIANEFITKGIASETEPKVSKEKEPIAHKKEEEKSKTKK